MEDVCFFISSLFLFNMQISKLKTLILISMCCSRCGCGFLHMLGTVPRTEAPGHIHNPKFRPHGQGLRHYDLRQWRALLPLHNHKPAAVPHHFKQVQTGIQGKEGIDKCCGMFHDGNTGNRLK